MKNLRKSPKRHKVRQHTRKNKPVREHARGRGTQKLNMTKIRKKTSPQILRKSKAFRDMLEEKYGFLRVIAYRQAKGSDKIQITGHTGFQRGEPKDLEAIKKVRLEAEKAFGKENILKVYGIEAMYPLHASINIKFRKGVI